MITTQRELINYVNEIAFLGGLVTFLTARVCQVREDQLG